MANTRLNEETVHRRDELNVTSSNCTVSCPAISGPILSGARYCCCLFAKDPTTTRNSPSTSEIAAPPTISEASNLFNSLVAVSMSSEATSPAVRDATAFKSASALRARVSASRRPFDVRVKVNVICAAINTAAAASKPVFWPMSKRSKKTTTSRSPKFKVFAQRWQCRPCLRVS